MTEQNDEPEQRSAIEIIREGVALAQAQDFAGALRSVDLAIHLGGSDVVVQHTAGVIYGMLGMHDESLKHLFKALEIDPNFYYTKVHIGLIFESLGQLETALEWFDKAIASDPKEVAPYEKAGLLESFRGRHDRAVELFTRACALMPDDARLNSHKAACEKAAIAADAAAALSAQLSAPPMTSGAPIASSHQNVPPPWSRVRLLRVDHFPGVSAAFDEIVEGMAYALHALGVTVDVAFNAPLTGGAVNIVIGAHGIPFRRGFPALPKRSIILNLEPPGSLAVQTQAYEQLLQSYPVWEYSDKNFELRKSAGQSNFVKFDIGYTPQLTRIKEAENHDVDVLFYGSVNDRRKQILDRIEAAGLRVHRAFGKFGAERDEMISRSKIVLNVHYHLDSIFEIVRCSYLLSNKKAVVCEVGSGTEIPADLRSAVVGCAYEDLVGACVSLARSEDARRRVAERGFELFSKRDQASLIARAMAETTWT